MQLAATRAWIIAGVALAVACVIAVVPAAPLRAPDTEARLAAGFDPLTALTDVVATASQNSTVAFEYSTLIGANDSVLDAVLPNTVDMLHQDLFESLHDIVPSGLGPQLSQVITDFFDFSASPASGVLLGLVGPVISPLVALGNSVGDLTGATPDPTAALLDLIDTPANVIGGFLGGANLNLDPLLPLLSDLVPKDTTVNSFGFAFPGLLSPGDTEAGAGGGSILNSVSTNLTFHLHDGTIQVDLPGEPVGPIAALTNLSQVVVEAMGSDGTGNPLADLTSPTLGLADLSGAAMMGASTAPTDTLANLL